MRTVKTNSGLTVQAIAGTYVVILAFDLPEQDCEGLLGFSIHRIDTQDNDAYYLEGMKTFEETDPGFPSGSLYSSRDQPFQSFQWADYSAKPGYTYTYTIAALKGTPKNLTEFVSTEIEVATEAVEANNHNVYFNRGTAASQEYVRRFGDKRPEDVPNNKTFEWLSRGIYEAAELFINTCIPGTHALRIAAYEFNYDPFLKLLKSTIDKGVDIKIVYDARKQPPSEGNRDKVHQNGLDDFCTPRTEGASYISHNKFIVKIENDNPVSVWTGGMNFSEGGIFGHSNVAHVIDDPIVAGTYLKYWKKLNENPTTIQIRKDVEVLTPLPEIPVSDGVSCVFSPRKTLDALTLYHDLALSAQQGFFMTFAFGINDIFKEVYRNSNCALRFALLEKKTRPMKKDSPERAAEEAAIQTLRNLKENVFAVGNFIETNEFDGWLKEKLSGLNSQVNYIHDKFMLVDPLGNDPIVITGSANFSDASTNENDENMVIIKGNKRVADIYFGEFMRLFSHYTFRESLPWRKPDDKPKPLKTDDWWRDYFGDTPRSIKRIFFTQVEA